MNVTNIVDLAAIPWYGAGWGSPYAAPYGAVWSYRSDVTLDPEGIADGEKTAEAQAREVADESGLKGAEVVGEEGDPADAVLRAADEHQVDVIVVGTHDRGLVRPPRPPVGVQGDHQGGQGPGAGRALTSVTHRPAGPGRVPRTVGG